MQIVLDVYWLASLLGGTATVVCGFLFWAGRTVIDATKTWTLATQDLEGIKKTVSEIKSQNEISRRDLHMLDMRMTSIESKVMLRIEMMETLKRCEQFFEKIAMLLSTLTGTKIDAPDLTGPMIRKQQQADEKADDKLSHGVKN